MLIDGIDMLPGRADYPRDQWYVAAFGSEVKREPMHRMLFGDPVVLFRTEAGEPVALFDRCPHRGMRLSNGGTVIGDTIQCHYHGIRYDRTGASCLIPSGGRPTAALSVHSYPLAEIGGWIWAWAGNPARADRSLIPDHAELGLAAEGFYDYYGAVLPSASNYLYSFENLPDATHITFLHHGLIDTGNVAAHPYRCVQDGAKVSMIREFSNEEVAPMVRRIMGIKGDRVNRVLDLRSYAPNVCVVRQVFDDVEFPDMPRRDTRLVFGITPAGPKSCYQFVAIAQNYENHHAGIFDDLRHLLMEDVVALDDIQKLFDLLGPDRVPEVSVRSDEGAIRSRRLIARQILAERGITAEAAE
jgi:vanillate O-demethylase monooxygenase subunit